MITKKEEGIFAEERKHLIVDLVNKNYKTTVVQLCNEFSVSPATIRNDLRELEEAGYLKRTHGGAISNKKASFEPNSYQKEVAFIEEKKMIAKAAAQYINEGDTIALDTGTTTFELAKLLVNFKNLTVVTNDLQIAAYLERNAEATVIIAGGAVRRNFHCTTGRKAIDTIKDLNVDKTFLAANGVSIKKGASTPNIDMARMKTVLVELADEIILLCDSSKLDRSTFVRFADIKQIDFLITDSGADSEYVDLLRREGIDVEVCIIEKSENK
jgi:DeoR family transcriptional regulator, fructose operon transcriptional repressor